MTTNKKITPPRRPKGFNDYLPKTATLRQWLMDKIRIQAKLACFEEISTGAIEFQEILMEESEVDTDVSKQIFKFTDNGNRAVGLRFDLTVPFARFCAEHVNEITLPFKKLQIGTVWRGENTQKGRYREFIQCDIDIIGVDTLLADVEIIQTMFTMLKEIIPQSCPFTMRLGHREVLNYYMEKFLNVGLDSYEIQQKILIQLDKLDKIGIEKVQLGLEDLFPQNKENVTAFLNHLKENRNCIPQDLFPRLSQTMEILQRTLSSTQIIFDVFLARGLAYYTGIVFETSMDEFKDYGSIASGGRYDNLAKRFINMDLPGVGGSIGLDRLVSILESENLIKESEAHSKVDVICCPMEENHTTLNLAIEILAKFRENKISATIFVKDQKIKNQLKYAQKIGARFAIIFGENEIKKGCFTLKDLTNFTQKENLSLSEIITIMKNNKPKIKKEWNPLEVENYWTDYWEKNQLYKAKNNSCKPKYYILDMFPYPSGAGLHVGHPLGYIASDIYARYKRHKGFNVLHPMGYDAFGLPAEQYAIQTGQHPMVTTEKNIKRYKEQLQKIGLSFDWSREFKTCDPSYYKWTQWVFIKLFQHYFDPIKNKARPIEEHPDFGKDGVDLMQYRLAYLADMVVNWCPNLGTVLANDEVVDGVSVRGSHPVEQKKMRQWVLRISDYAPRLLEGLDTLDWPVATKEMQRNWIGKSIGSFLEFSVKGLESNNKNEVIKVFTTRPDTIFGVGFILLASEHELVEKIIENISNKDQIVAIRSCQDECKKKNERQRLANTKNVTGVFTGAYAIHPLTKKDIPIWIADYVLMGYGTGAVMGVPAHDERDNLFAKTFNLPLLPVIQSQDANKEDGSYFERNGVMINSDFLNGLSVEDAIVLATKKIGQPKTFFKLRDAIFSRQRYWGEPFPIYYKDDQKNTPYCVDESELPIKLPEVDQYLPTETGLPPLARAKNFSTKDGYAFELNTMPGFAGSSAYYLRFMDPHNDQELTSKTVRKYWKNVDFYVGGSEHACGHLIYARFWNMFLYDIGLSETPEPFQKLVNQGMIQGRSSLVYRIKGTNQFVSAGLLDKNKYDTFPIHVDISFVENDLLDINKFQQWREEHKNSTFILEDGKYRCGVAIEKMSKSMHNVVNPDSIIEKYGADCLRLYEMFLGPIEQSKPWGTSGIEGIHRFIQKVVKYFDNEIDESKPLENELKILHTLIKKVTLDMENLSFNTSVAALMIFINDISKISCTKREILTPFVVVLSPFAPFLSEFLWERLGNEPSVTEQEFPSYDDEYLKDSHYSYPISVNGKMKFLVEIPMEFTKEEIQNFVLAQEKVKSLIAGKELKKIIIVEKKMINFVF